MNVLRLNPDLAIVPSMVQSVHVERNDYPRMHAMTDEPRWTGGRVPTYSVRVRYLMSSDPVAVASFDGIYDHYYDPDLTFHDGRNHITLGGYVPVDPDEFEEHRAAAEARAHVVYEEIIRAVRDAE